MVRERNQFVSTRNRNLAAAGAGNFGSFGLNQNLTKFRSNRKMGPITNAVLIILLVMLMGLMYLTQLAKTGAFSYQLNSIDEQKTSLTAQQENLKVENARLQSLSTVSGSTVAAQMTTPSNTTSAE